MKNSKIVLRSFDDPDNLTNLNVGYARSKKNINIRQYKF